MRKQRVLSQLKGQEKTPEEQVDEENIRIMIMKMIQDLGNRMEKIQEMLTKDQELKDKWR